MNYDEHKCPDRCDIEFTYDWDHTNLNLNVIDGKVAYMLNGGDEVKVKIRNVKPDGISVMNESGESIELADNGSNEWSGKIPSGWDQKGIFNVILKKGSCKLLLWQGLLNYDTESLDKWDGTIYGLGDSFVQTSSKGMNVTRNENGEFVITLNNDLIKSTDNTIGVESDNGSYDLSCKCKKMKEA